MDTTPTLANASKCLKLIQAGAKKATSYVGPQLVVKATRRGKPRKNSRTLEILLTLGKPNYAERKFISRCQKTGEPFPVKKIQVKWDSK